MNRKLHNEKQARRANRTRAKVRGTADRPRLTIFRSNRSLYAQVIDDSKHATVAAASTAQLEKAAAKKNKVEQGTLLGALIAERAKAAGVTAAVFDRGSYRFHGRVKAVAEGARSAGLNI
jgi:large subunit ribosomal protein L18